MIEKRQYIDGNGEIVSERMVEFADMMNEQGYRFPSHKLGARMFRDVSLPEEMSYTDKGMMSELSRYHMIPAANMLGYRKGVSLVPYTQREIGELVHLKSRSKCSRFTNKMLRLHVMHRIQDSSGIWQHYVNPAFYLANGQRLSISLFLLFQRELTPLLPAWVMYEFLRQSRSKAILSSDAKQEAERIVNGNSNNR